MPGGEKPTRMHGDPLQGGGVTLQCDVFILPGVRALWLEDRRLSVRDTPTPEPPPGEALVRVVRAGICNTDIELTRGYDPFTGVPGHEFVGVVERGGPGSLSPARFSSSPYRSVHTASSLPLGSVKWNRRPPGKENGGFTIFPPASLTFASTSSSRVA